MGMCSVPLCNNRGEEKIPGISFHRFPTDKHMSRIWATYIGRPNWNPSPYSRICSVHFPKEDYNGKRLKKTAAPTIFYYIVPKQSQSKPQPQIVVELNQATLERKENVVENLLQQSEEAADVSEVTQKPEDPSISSSIQASSLPSIDKDKDFIQPSTPSETSKISPIVEDVLVSQGVKMDIYTPREAALLRILRATQRKCLVRSNKLRSLQRQTKTLNRKVVKMKIIIKDLKKKLKCYNNKLK